MWEPFMGYVRWRVAVVIFVFGLGITCQVVACDHTKKHKGRSGISTKNLRGVKIARPTKAKILSDVVLAASTSADTPPLELYCKDEECVLNVLSTLFEVAALFRLLLLRSSTVQFFFRGAMLNSLSNCRVHYLF
jgi:hypothetical protein